MTRIIKAEQSDGEKEPATTVLRLADLAAEARSLVLDARKEAARIVADARAQAEEAERHAGEKGYAEGHARGQESGYAEGRRQALAEACERLAAESADLIPLARKAVEELARARARFAEEAGRQIVRLAARIAEKIVGRLAEADVEAARVNLAKALELAGRSGQWTVLVHPDQLASLRESLPELMDALGLSGEVRWTADKRIARGGVKVLTGRGEIDATLETQLANVVEALLGTDPHDRPTAAEPGSDSYVSEGPRAGSAEPIAPQAGAPRSHRVIRPISGWESSKGQERV